MMSTVTKLPEADDWGNFWPLGAATTTHIHDRSQVLGKLLCCQCKYVLQEKLPVLQEPA